MSLTAKEMQQLRNLQLKAENVTPLTEIDITAIEVRTTEACKKDIEIIQGVQVLIGSYWEKLGILADDNAKLIGEVRRLHALLAEKAITEAQS